jgi:hypothetical protein
VQVRYLCKPLLEVHKIRSSPRRSKEFASPWPYTFYQYFTEGLRLFNTEPRGRVYSVDGPGSTAVFLSQLPESLGLAAGRSPSTVCC